MSETPDRGAAEAHDLRIEQGGSRMERFVYGWCPCGWQYDADAQSGFAGDRIKRAFANHLKGLRDASDLARETPFTVDEWQHALNALGDRAATLLPTVKDYAARQHLTPHAAACAVLEATDGT